jgi:hypothetical protein
MDGVLTMKKAVKRVMMTTQPAKNRNTPNSMEHNIVTKLCTAEDGLSGWQPARRACMFECTEPAWQYALDSPLGYQKGKSTARMYSNSQEMNIKHGSNPIAQPLQTLLVRT